MKNSMLKKTIVLTAMLTTGLVSFAQQEEKQPNKTEFSVEIDPATFAFGGYSLHLKIKPKNSEHLLLGIGAYAMDMPNVLVDFNPKNKAKGWDVRLNQGLGFFTEHHFTEVNKKWFIGTQLSIQEYKIENETISGNEKFTNLLTMAYVGYTIKPFKNNIYIKPWAGIGYSSKIAGKNNLGTLKYNVPP